MRKNKNLLIVVMFVVTIVSRFAYLGTYPLGVDVDEAYSGYEAWSILNYGTDSWGYVNPVYLETWGSGMSVLYSLLSIPFIKMIGLNTLSIRIAQAVFGSLTVVVFYLLLKKVADSNIAICGSFLLAISPWHIILSRYGLDANLTPAFILTAMYFSILAIESNSKLIYWILSAAFWGFSLYCYAVAWLFVPMVLMISSIYCIKYGKINVKDLVCFWSIVCTLALPLVCFVAVNIGLMEEVNTSFISITKLAAFRTDEFDISNIITNFKVLLRILIKQNDFTLRNCISYFGINYLFSLPFILYGGWITIKGMVSNINNKKFGYDLILLSWIIISLVIGLIKSMNIQRINFLHLAIYILLARGICRLCELFGDKFSKAMLIIYACSFIIFIGYYFTKYQDDIGVAQLSGAKEALDYAIECVNDGIGDEIHILGSLGHSRVIFYTEYPTDKFIEDVEWKNYPDKWVSAKRLGAFYWDDSIEIGDNYIYIVTKDRLDEFEQMGYEISIFDNCAVVY